MFTLRIERGEQVFTYSPLAFPLPLVGCLRYPALHFRLGEFTLVMTPKNWGCFCRPLDNQVYAPSRGSQIVFEKNGESIPQGTHYLLNTCPFTVNSSNPANLAAKRAFLYIAYHSFLACPLLPLRRFLLMPSIIVVFPLE